MIKLEDVDLGYLTCHSCNSNKELSEIIIGLTERQTVQVRLCKNCAEELGEKIIMRVNSLCE